MLRLTVASVGMISDGDLEEVPSNDDLENDVDNACNNGIDETSLCTANKEEYDGKNDGDDDSNDVHDLGELNDFSSPFLVVLLEPVVPQPCRVYWDHC